MKIPAIKKLVENHDLAAFGRQRFCICRADPLRGAGHNTDAAFNPVGQIVGSMNQMLRQVIDSGTGKAAKLDR